MESFLLSHSYLWGAIGYWIAFFGVMVEGDALIFLSFFLAYQGFFSIGKLFLVLLIGVLIGDVLWYYLGTVMGKIKIINRFLNRVRIDLIDQHFLRKPFHAIFITKFIYGTYHITLMRIGALKFNLKKFMQYQFFANIVWISVVGFLGYISGAGFLAVKKYFRYTEIGLLLALIIFIIVEYFIRRGSEQIGDEEKK